MTTCSFSIAWMLHVEYTIRVTFGTNIRRCEKRLNDVNMMWGLHLMACLIMRSWNEASFFRRSSAAEIPESSVGVSCSSRWSRRFTIPDPLQDGSSKLRDVRWSDGWDSDTCMCVTLAYLGSSGWMVRKSMLVGSVFLQSALESMVLRVVKRFLSLSKANSCCNIRFLRS